MQQTENIHNRIMWREKVFQYIVKNPGNFDSIKQSLRAIVPSKKKLSTAIDDLMRDKRIIIKNREVRVNGDKILDGRYFKNGKKQYVLAGNKLERYDFNPKAELGFIKNGQKVKVAISIYENRFEPIIVEKIQENLSSDIDLLDTDSDENDIFEHVIGRVMKSDHDNLIFIPNDRRKFKQNIVITNDKKTQGAFQDKICKLRILSNERSDQPAYGFIEQILGEAGNPVQEYDIIALSHGAQMNWDDATVAEEIKKAPLEVNPANYNLVSEGEDFSQDVDGKESIVDLRGLNFTTTDPADCKDMDDAIYSTFDKKGNLLVYTAVANVSKYIALTSEIGKRYLKASFTQYAPNKAYNILPPQYSTNICSLNPNVDRLALVIKTTIDSKSGLPKHSEIFDALICSKEKYSYEEAQKIVDGNQTLKLDVLREKVIKGEELSKDEQVVMNYHASNILDKGFKKRNMIKFDSQGEYEVKFNKDMSDIVDIVSSEHIDYHQVIENFMITANEATAQYALKHGIPNIYRVHDKPNEDKLAQAEEFFQFLNIPFDGDLSPTGLQKILQTVEGTSMQKAVNEFLIRMQSKAQYSISPNPKEKGYISQHSKKKGTKKAKNKEFNDAINALDQEISHFGLQSEHYSHSTSPIRRLPDYVTHYNILAHIRGRKLLDEKTVNDLASWANIRQDQTDMAEREFIELNSAIYCEHHIGDIMRGQISAFKKPENSIGAEDVVVIVENSEKGIKVSIPLSDVLSYTGKRGSNIGFSKSGCAIINKESGAPVLTICQEVPFKIIEANRISREIKATCNLEKEKDFARGEIIGHYPNKGKSSSATHKKQRMLANREYNSAKKEEEQNKNKNTNQSKGSWYKENSVRYRNMSPVQIETNNKRDCKRHKHKRLEVKNDSLYRDGIDLYTNAIDYNEQES